MIRGYFDPSRPPHPYLDVAVFVDGVTPADGAWPQIPFVVDSGASQTVIHPKDSVRRLGLSVAQLTTPSLWSTPVANVGVGGSTTSFESNAAFGFLSDNGTWRVVTGKVRVAELTRQNQHIPSLLGWDLLRHFRTTITGEPPEIVLEWLKPT